MTSGPEGTSAIATAAHDAADDNGIQMTEGLKELLQRTRYPLVQENGQRRYGPPPGWEGSPPPKGCEVFVGKIPRDLFEDELIPVMERAGRVYEARLMLDQTGVNRGYGFVQYSSRGEAEAALHSLNNYEVRPKRYLGVMRSVDNNRLFVGGIPKNRSREEVLEEMRRITEGVVKIILYPCVNDRTKNRGYAFVEYTSHKAAAMARRRLFSGRILLWGTTEVKVDWAEPELDVDSDIMSKVKVLYIRNLALYTTEDDIRNLCSASGGVERVKKQKDYAFVHFSTREQAEAVMQALNGKMVHGCELEVTWAKPVKNREEYQQRKALARSMISSSNGQPSYVPHLTLSGEPVMIVPQVRRAAGAQGLQHHAPRMLPARPRTTEAQLMSIPAPALFMPQEPPIKSPTEFIIPGYAAAQTQLLGDKVASPLDDSQSVSSDHLQQLGVPGTPTTNLGLLYHAGQTMRAQALPPQYFMAPQMSMGAPVMTPTLTSAPHQGMAVSPGTFLVPSAPLTGYETFNPYALQAAFYQQALMTQPGMTTLERPRYSTTGE